MPQPATTAPNPAPPGLSAMLAGAALHERLLEPAVTEVCSQMQPDLKLRVYLGLLGAIYGSMQRDFGQPAAANSLLILLTQRSEASSS
jgi:hypothetical protein